MWQFEKYNRREVNIPSSAIMALRTGLENRYADRFRAYAGTTDDNIRSTDEARKVVESIRTASGVIDTQKENIAELFAQAELMVKMINDLQRETGVKQIKNIPLPGDSIKSSPGKQLGYVKLAMRFVSAGLLHFMEMTLQMKDDLDSRDQVIKMIAENRAEIPVVGRLVDIELDELSSSDPIVDTKVPLEDEASTTEEIPPPTNVSGAPITPPKTPQPKPLVKPRTVSPTVGKVLKK